MAKNLYLYQYSCPSCEYTIYSESADEQFNCKNNTCTFKENLFVINQIDTKIVSDSRKYKAKESFMINHGCNEVRSITKGTEFEIIKIKKDWFLLETNDGISFFAPQSKFERVNS